MSAQSVGQIGLDLVINKNDFERQMGGIQKLAKNAGKALASAFAVKKIIDFGKECLELGSDLAEVQNVVDVTFPAMSKKVDEFAQGAANAFGLSETMAKQFTGTFGAMAKAFGFTEQQAYDMGATLTGLAGDVASFYNIDQKEAYTKLKSVFTGETESLKDLGIVMTQTALDSYALANGFGKTTAKMTEAEKVALRYKFVQEQLAAATGDFARTSGGWANQVRILSLQFDSLKATIGQGLINLFTPVIRIINTLIGKLMVLASAFKSFTELITGNKGTGMAADMENTAQAAGNAAAAVGGVGDAAAASAKKAKRALAGFDELQTLEKQDSGGGTGVGSAGGGIDFGTLDTGALEEAETRTDALLGKWKELALLLKKGFSNGLGSVKVFDSIRKSAEKLTGSIQKILEDGSVADAARGALENIVYAAGQSAGAGVSIGASIADNILGGLSGYVEGNRGRIQEYLVSMFNITGKKAEIRGNLAAALAEVFGSLRSDGAKDLSGALLGIFADAFMGITGTMAQFSLDVTSAIAQPFLDNQDGLRTALEGYLGVLAGMAGSIKQAVDDTFDDFGTMYDLHVRPFFGSMADGLSGLAAEFLAFWNGSIQPFLDRWAEGFSALYQECIQPIVGSFISLLGEAADLLKVVWEEILSPFISWMIENILPVLLPIFDGFVNAFLTVKTGVYTIVNSIMSIFRGLLQFLSGVFTGEWGKAWDGIIKIFENVSIWMKTIVNTILGVIESMANGVVGAINKIIEAINGLDIKNPLTGEVIWSPSIKPISTISIPKLAQGGYVRPNTPQLAMIGDNRHQGEIVAPEDKMYQVSAQAMWDVMQKYMAAMKAMMSGNQGNGSTTIVLKVTGEMAPFVRLLKAELDKEANRSGINLEVVCE